MEGLGVAVLLILFSGLIYLAGYDDGKTAERERNLDDRARIVDDLKALIAADREG